MAITITHLPESLNFNIRIVQMSWRRKRMQMTIEQMAHQERGRVLPSFNAVSTRPWLRLAIAISHDILGGPVDTSDGLVTGPLLENRV